MLFPKDEIIADVDGQIKKMGGKYSDWCVGIAKDSQEPFFQAHLIADKSDGFLYREAYTPNFAREILEHFVTQGGAILDASSQNGGRLVYAYPKTPLKPSVQIKKSRFAQAVSH
jgi:hypothetical protein